jgi:glycosyltransferase involved in cell wall biosynthesis
MEIENKFPISKNLNVFIIPSWYPSTNDVVSGIFVKEQVSAISNLFPNVACYVSCWGQQSGHLSLRNLRQTKNAFLWRIVNFKSKICYHSNNLIEIFSPSLSWSCELPFGGHNSILSVNRHNLNDLIKSGVKIDLIHAHVVYPAGVVASILSKEFDIPYVITEHLGPTRLPKMFFSDGKFVKLIYDTYKNARRIIVVSEFLNKELSKFEITNTLVIPNLVNELNFFPQSKKSDRFIFFTLCVIGEGKGIDLLLYSIQKFIVNFRNVEFWIGGEGARLTYYKDLARNLGISHYIKWLGKVERDDAPRYFQDCNVFVLPSSYETFGVVFAEAIACGKPIISTKCGGPESIVTKNNGLLVELNNITQLCNAMEFMMKNIDKYSSDEIRNDFIQRFSRKAVVEKIVGVYLSNVNFKN